MKKTLLYSVVSLMLFACGPNVKTSKMTNKSLTSYETFAYLPNSNFDDLEKFDTNNDVGSVVIDHVNKNMKEEGYTMDRANPDLLLLLDTTTDLETTVTKDPVYASYPAYYDNNYSVSPYYQDYYYYDYYGYNNLVGYETDVDTYKEGSLILSLVDSDTKQIIWKANASNFIGSQNDSNAISKYVDDIFEEFPNSK